MFKINSTKHLRMCNIMLNSNVMQYLNINYRSNLNLNQMLCKYLNMNC